MSKHTRVRSIDRSHQHPFLQLDSYQCAKYHLENTVNSYNVMSCGYTSVKEVALRGMKALLDSYVVILVPACVFPTALPAQDAASPSPPEPTMERPTQNSLQKVQAVASQETGSTVMSITLGEPQQIFHFRHPDSMGLFNVPDMHTAVLQQADKSYMLWITGNIGPSDGSIARLSTKDFFTMRMPDRYAYSCTTSHGSKLPNDFSA